VVTAMTGRISSRSLCPLNTPWITNTAPPKGTGWPLHQHLDHTSRCDLSESHPLSDPQRSGPKRWPIFAAPLLRPNLCHTHICIQHITAFNIYIMVIIIIYI
jgi:hypothetical protein